MSPRMPDYDALRAQEARARESANDPEGRALVQAIHDRKARSMAGFRSQEDLEEAARATAATIARFAKAMDELGEMVRKLSRDLIRASRRPALIHNGGRPRG